jgi:hypothetical protein
MAITTLDGVLAGMQAPRHFAKAATGTLSVGRPQSLWPLAGSPGAGAYDATLNGTTLSSTSTIPSGAIPHVDPGAGNAYLARLSAASSQPGVLILADRIWVNQLAVSNATAQAITSPTWPARDAAGSTNGDGVLLAIETSAAASATAAAITVTYTNQAGTGSRTANFLDATIAAVTVPGAFFRIGLQAGDTGVRSVQSVTFNTQWTTGTINMVAYRPLAAVELIAAQIGNAVDALTGGFPRLYNGTVPFLFFIPSSTLTTNISGTYVESQG